MAKTHNINVRTNDDGKVIINISSNEEIVVEGKDQDQVVDELITSVKVGKTAAN